jgi:hypothetical protein
MLADKLPYSFSAGEDLSAKAMRAVTRGATAGDVILTSSGGGDPQEGLIDQGGGATSGDAVRVIKYGRAKGIAAGVLSANMKVVGVADGKLAEASTGDYILGTLEEDAAADGDEVMVFVEPSLVVI